LGFVRVKGKRRGRLVRRGCEWVQTKAQVQVTGDEASENRLTQTGSKVYGRKQKEVQKD